MLLPKAPAGMQFNKHIDGDGGRGSELRGILSKH
jgi:hypothetical protein